MERNNSLSSHYSSEEENTIINSMSEINLTEISLYCLNVVIDGQQSKDINDQCVNFLKNSNQTFLRQLLEILGNYSIETLEVVDEKALPPYVQKWHVMLIWSLIFGTMVIMAIIGNLLIICVISTQKMMRTVINIFLLNLTISDLFTVTFNASFNFVFMLTGDWPFGEFYCVASNFISNLTIASTVFTIIATSVDRYIAIVHPLKPRMTKRRAIVNITIIWLSASFFASPTLLYSQNIVIPYTADNQRTICLLKWPDGYAGQSSLDFAYNIAFLLFTYILPMVTMAIAYYLMAKVLWGSERIGESTPRQLELIRSKQKVVCMLICVIAVFGCCWLPYHVYFLCIYIWPQLIHGKQIQHIYLAIYWLAMANSLFNPIILFVMNNRFRQYISQYKKCYCMAIAKQVKLESSNSIASSNLNIRRMSNKNNNNRILSHYNYRAEITL